MTEERVIGRDGGIPWHIPDDLKLFRELTMGHAVVMGRKTFESMGKPLKGRLNIVISSMLQATLRGTEDESKGGIVICPTFEDALNAAAGCENREIFIIGGTEVYQRALPIADRMCISRVKHRYEGDTFFPSFSEEEWTMTSIKPYEEFDLAVYERNFK